MGSPLNHPWSHSLSRTHPRGWPWGSKPGGTGEEAQAPCRPSGALLPPASRPWAGGRPTPAGQAADAPADVATCWAQLTSLAPRPWGTPPPGGAAELGVHSTHPELWTLTLATHNRGAQQPLGQGLTSHHTVHTSHSTRSTRTSELGNSRAVHVPGPLGRPPTEGTGSSLVGGLAGGSAPGAVTGPLTGGHCPFRHSSRPDLKGPVASLPADARIQHNKYN